MKNLDFLKTFSLEDKVIVVTGALGQLGQQFSCALCGAGAKVAALDVTEPTAALANNSQLTKYFESGQIRFFKADITNKKQLNDVLSEIKKTLGQPSGLINNAALDSPPNAPVEENGPFETYPEASFSKLMNVNVSGTVLACQVFGGEMAKNGSGSIINISSIYGLVSPVQDIYEYKRETGEQWYKPVGYAVSKSAILNLTRYLATYWGQKGVRVNTLTPAGIFNNQDERFLKGYLQRLPMGRMANKNELNGAVVFLLSEASSYMTGSNLVIDGGWTAW